MTQQEKRRQELREAVEELEQRGHKLLEDHRNAGGTHETLSAKQTADLEQINMDLSQRRTELEEVNRQADAIAAATQFEEHREYWRDAPTAMPAPTGHERSDIMTLGAADWRPNFRALRDAHPLFKPWQSLGDFCRSVAMAELKGGPQDERMAAYFEQRAPTGFGEAMDADGGALVPAQFAAELLATTFQSGQVVSRCRVLPMSSRQLRVPAVDETSRADGSRMGGVQAYWEGEGDALTATKGKFRTVNLEANRLTAGAYASDELLEDLPALGAWLTMAFTEELTFKTEAAIVEGDGAGKPLGFLHANNGSLVVVSKESGPQTADTIVAENVIKMRSRLYVRSRQNAVWFVNQDCEPQLHAMFLEGTSSSIPVYLPANGLSGSPFDSLYARAVIPIEFAATLGDQGDISLVDLQHYLLGRRGGVQTAMSIHVNFLKHEKTFRFTVRLDGQPWWTSAITPYKGTATVSPFVTLEAR